MRVRNPAMDRHGRFFCLLGILLLLIMTRYTFQIDIPRVVFLFIVGTIVICGNQNEIIAMIICCIPMHESIDFFYALTICSIVYVFRYFNQMRIGISILLVILIVIWELLHCFGTYVSVVYSLSGIIPFIVLAIIMSSSLEKLDYPFIVRVFAWVTFSIILMMFIRVLYFADFNIMLALQGLKRMGSDYHSNIKDVTITGGQIQSNSLGIITVLASSGLMQIRRIQSGNKSDMVLMCAMIVLAALGTSRTYLACLALMIVLLVLSERGGLLKKMRLIIILCFVMAVAVIVLAVFFPDSFAYFIERFSASDISSGRNDLMKQYHEFIVNNMEVMFFGIGLQNYGDRLIHFYRVANNVPHNSVQEIIIAWGIPGFILFALQIICIYKVSLSKNKNQSLINWIPLIIILFKGIAGQTLTSSYSMLALLFAYLSMYVNLKPVEQKRV